MKTNQVFRVLAVLLVSGLLLGAERAEGADVQFRDGSHHVGDSPGARVYPAGQDYQI